MEWGEVTRGVGEYHSSGFEARKKPRRFAHVSLL